MASSRASSSASLRARSPSFSIQRCWAHSQALAASSRRRAAEASAKRSRSLCSIHSGWVETIGPGSAEPGWCRALADRDAAQATAPLRVGRPAGGRFAVNDGERFIRGWSSVVGEPVALGGLSPFFTFLASEIGALGLSVLLNVPTRATSQVTLPPSGNTVDSLQLTAGLSTEGWA
eukprot:scaffold36191_cov26-Tisochrysis_lutea.AAC.3